MTYKIIEKVGKYKIGDEVSDEVGITLSKMYVKSPVERIEKNATKVEEPEVEAPPAPKVEEEPKSKKKKKLF
jgi:hypothetical protein